MLRLIEARKLVEFFQPRFEAVCEPGRCVPAGGYRRGKDWIHDLEFVVEPLKKAPKMGFGVKPRNQPRTLLDVVLSDLEREEYLFFQQGDKKNRKYWINFEKFGLTRNSEFTLDLWITTPPAQFGVNLAIRTGPNNNTNPFSKWMVTPRAKGGALPDGHRVRQCAVWREGQLAGDEPYPGESPLSMPTEEQFMDFIGVTAEPCARKANWRQFR